MRYEGGDPGSENITCWFNGYNLPYVAGCDTEAGWADIYITDVIGQVVCTPWGPEEPGGGRKRDLLCVRIYGNVEVRPKVRNELHTESIRPADQLVQEPVSSNQADHPSDHSS